jgi:hypothetical protein
LPFTGELILIFVLASRGEISFTRGIALALDLGGERAAGWE